MEQERTLSRRDELAQLAAVPVDELVGQSEGEVAEHLDVLAHAAAVRAAGDPRR
jgi:hypothetical protein